MEKTSLSDTQDQLGNFFLCYLVVTNPLKLWSSYYNTLLNTLNSIKQVFKKKIQ